ncbi:MAG: metal-binding protein ZinT [Clostridiales bacterium]|jgi:hypothetical protein|nr:metal-binding protein ZinT [Clostridiales bacterium]
MKRNTFIAVLSLVLCLAVLGACKGGGGLPDGIYKPFAVTVSGIGRTELSGTAAAAYVSYSIEIKGDTLTFHMSGLSESAKYSYKDGKITLKESASTSISLHIAYENDTLVWDLGGGMTMELKK